MKKAKLFAGLFFLMGSLFLFVTQTLELRADPTQLFCSKEFGENCPLGGCTIEGEYLASQCKITGCALFPGYVECKKGGQPQ